MLAEQKRTERLLTPSWLRSHLFRCWWVGIGIMNIMLASILERTREIGLPPAVGARQSDVVRQFVIEAVMIYSWAEASVSCSAA